MPGVLIGILIGLAGVAAIIWVCFGIQNHFDEAARRARAEDITEALNDAEEQFLHWRRLFQSNSLSVPVFLCSAPPRRHNRRASVRPTAGPSLRGAP